jgi:DNA-binding helix-hairpin-helix protein with protein kinase domain
LRRDDGEIVVLGSVLTRAGEGTIYAVADRIDLVVKVFHADLKDLAAKRAKVAAMIASPPAGAIQSDGFVVLTWPLHLVNGEDGLVGYVMPRINTANAVEIHSISNPSARMSPLPSAPQWTQHVTWRHLVNAAMNLCLAVDTVHRVDAVIGDFQERNILVNDTTQVTLVDCDSMQFTDAAGERFLCGVGRPEFTAPELAGANLSTTPREKPSDLFALAVHIHLLLMAGNHPFLRGEWTGGGDQPDAMTLARSGQWAGAPGSALRTHPLAPPVTFLPNAIQQLFRRAFTDGARDPHARPSAAEWLSALKEVGFSTCSRGHQIPIGTTGCPWCGIDDERARRRSARVQDAEPQVSTRPAPEPSVPLDPPTTEITGGRRRFVALAVLSGFALAVLVGVAVGQIQTSRTDSAYTPTRTATTTPLRTPTYTPAYTSTYTSPSVRSTYPAPHAQSFDSVYQNAKVGECVNSQSGSQREDGSYEVTSLYLTDCGSPDATDKVIKRTTDINECYGSWVRSDGSGIVLCLRPN